MARPEKVRLGEVLVQQKLISEEQLTQALNEQKSTGRKLGRVLVGQGLVTEEQISMATARQLNIPYINLKFYNLQEGIVHLLPETQMRRLRAIVLEEHGKALLVGMADPTDLYAYDEIARLLRRDIELAVINESDLLHALGRLYRRTGEISDFARALEQDVSDNAIDFGGQFVLEAKPDEALVVKLLQSLFHDATQIQASTFTSSHRKAGSRSVSASTECSTSRLRPTSRSRRRWPCA